MLFSLLSKILETLNQLWDSFLSRGDSFESCGALFRETLTDRSPNSLLGIVTRARHDKKVIELSPDW